MTDAPEMQSVRVNDRWTLNLPKHRAERPGWPWWERDALHSLWCHIRPGDVVWDIGAEEGDLSALYASWGAELCLAESSARAWPWIRETLAANEPYRKPLCMAHCLVGSTNRGALLGAAPSLWPAAAELPFEPDAGFVHLNEAGETPIRTLDVLHGGMFWPAPDLIVMDIEGAEYQALLGAERLLSEVRPTFAISVHPEFMRSRYNDTPDDLLVLFELAGYECRYLGYDHEQHWLMRPRP